jgi:hypothetical protein
MDTATILASDLAHALLHPAPTTPFKQLGSERMQVIKELAAIFDKMAPQQEPTPRVMEPTPRVPNLNIHIAPSPRVPSKQPTSPISTVSFPGMPRRSPRQHQPAIISQEERAYQLLETPPACIETAFAVTDQLMGQKLEYQHLLK